MSEDMVVYETHNMKIARRPKEILEDAREAAVELQKVVSQKPKKVMMNGEQYLEFEDWQTCGNFYGITARVTHTAFIDYGAAQGFEASADAIDSQGNVLSSADAMCMNDEEKWSARPKYQNVYILNDGTTSIEDPPVNKITWVDNPGKPGKKMPKRERKLIGEEKVPLFQLRSMAQTRACAKVLRNVLSWVVVLAGYKATPAEEIQDMSQAETVHDANGKAPAEEKAPIKEPLKKEIKDPEAPASENQVKAIYTMLSKLDIKGDDIQHNYCGFLISREIKSMKDITKGEASTLIEKLQEKLTEMKA